MNCIHCQAEFTPKRATAQYCSPKCRVADARRRAQQLAAENGDPSVVWVPQDGTNELPEGTRRCEPEAVNIPPAPKIEPCKKLPVEATPLRADTNHLARQVIANMKSYKAPTELEHLEKNQLKK